MKTLLLKSGSALKRKNGSKGGFKLFSVIFLILIILSSVAFSLPFLLNILIKQQQAGTTESSVAQFPVSVDPKSKRIIQNDTVEKLLQNTNSPLQASIGNNLWNTFTWLATTISSLPLYQSIADVDGGFVTITPGMRKEQVANAFAIPLRWTNQDKQDFLTPRDGQALPLPEGSFAPGIYFVETGTTPDVVQTLVNDRFYKDVLSHYGTTTQEIVPLNEALTIASLIEKESGGANTRLISGIIWNRIFAGMNLQIDATLQYAKADTAKTSVWWPKVAPKDKFIDSLYNTYSHTGLPPTPIANPSVASILAALNPLKTSCIFYFNDNTGKIHCSDTYIEHVALLKKYFGQGK